VSLLICENPLTLAGQVSSEVQGHGPRHQADIILSGEAVLYNNILRHAVDCVRGINVQVMPSRCIAHVGKTTVEVPLTRTAPQINVTSEKSCCLQSTSHCFVTGLLLRLPLGEQTRQILRGTQSSTRPEHSQICFTVPSKLLTRRPHQGFAR
jgi:hypothetical protein